MALVPQIQWTIYSTPCFSLIDLWHSRMLRVTMVINEIAQSETWSKKYTTMVIYLESLNSIALKPSSDNPPTLPHPHSNTKNATPPFNISHEGGSRSLKSFSWYPDKLQPLAWNRVRVTPTSWYRFKLQLLSWSRVRVTATSVSW